MRFKRTTFETLAADAEDGPVFVRHPRKTDNAPGPFRVKIGERAMVRTDETERTAGTEGNAGNERTE